MFTPEEKQAWRTAQRQRPSWKGLYGWRLMPVIIESAVLNPDTEKPETTTLPFPEYSRKVFSHPPGAILVGSARHRREQGRYYVVFRDHSLRAISKGVFETLSQIKPEERLPVLLGERPLFVPEAAA